MGGNGEIDETLAPPEEVITPLGEAEEKQRLPMLTLPVAQRLNSFVQVELGLSEDMAIEEARRCLRCDLEERE